MKVAFQGQPGAYSEQAARMFFGTKRITTVPCKDFKAIFRQVESGKSKLAIVPVENSTAGSIYENYDLLLDSKVWISGECKLRVKHNLLGIPGSSLKKLKRVYSHPQALMQCSQFLGSLKGEHVAHFDTAGAAEWIAEKGDVANAAIASDLAAEEYGLKVLKRGIENNSANFTRFVLVEKRSKTPKKLDKKAKHKTSIVFALKNIPGGLHKALSVFAIRDIDLLKLQSRPIPGSPWKYYFYLDFEGSISEEKGAKAIDHLQEITKICRVLGSYPVSKS